MLILKPSRLCHVFVVTCLIVLLGVDRSYAQERVAADEDGHIIDFVRDIVPILQTRCFKCHNEEEAKGDFRIDDPDSVFSYVEPEDLESSSLYFDYLLSDDPDTMMPPPKKGGPLLPHELSMIGVWIQEGANWPEGMTITAAGESAESTESTGEAASEPVAEEPRSLVDRVWTFQGFFHPATVHFPIALFLFGAFFVVLGWKWPALGKQIPLACLLLGAPTAIASTAMGWSLASEEGYASWMKIDMDSEIFWHRWSGVIVAVTSLVLAVIALLGIAKRSEKMGRIWKIGLLVIAGIVGAVGHQGGELKYGKDFYPRAFRILLGTDGEAASADVPAAADKPANADGESESGDEAEVDEAEVAAMVPKQAAG